MVNIRLKRLSLRNFKGIKDLAIDFGYETNIYGENASGKTTIFDAFNWLLFDKDSADRSAFNIKTLDKTGDTIHGIEHEVEAVLVIDNVSLTLKKIYKEKWVKRKGETEKLLTGHETLYWIDEVPARKKEYVEKIQSIISEDVFKLITNPLHFNTNIKWLDRRNLLDQIVGGVDDLDIMSKNKKLQPLLEALNGKSIEDYKKVISAQRKKLNNEIKAIPIRIDELSNSLPSLDINFEAIEQQLVLSQKEINMIDACILDSSQFYEDLSKRRDDLYDKKSQLQKLEYTAQLEKDKPLQKLHSQLKDFKSAIWSANNHLTMLTSQRKDLGYLLKTATETIEAKRDEWHRINLETLEFNEYDFVCPACNRGFEEVDVQAKKEEVSQRFIDNKTKNLQKINEEGALYSQKIEEYQEQIDKLDPDIEKQTKELKNLKNKCEKLDQAITNYIPVCSLSSNQEYLALKKDIESIEKSMDTTTMDNTIKGLQVEKDQIVNEMDSLKTQLATKEQHKKMQSRIEQLKEEEKALAEQIAKIEGQEYLCEEFVREKVNYLESRINSNFEKVTFKLFNTLVNGSIEECCETLIGGVPFDDANTEGQVNGGIDIINTLSKHFKIRAPIFVDNREGVIELQKTDAQLVNLRVREVTDHKKSTLKELKGTNNKKLYTEVI